ncbi:MAG: alcohol dehydrogenase catalytic domain-containing protein [Chloroflexi bacterium]|nr:alcohol dehydrogenase catalytic domain-containing protein [Chloroflexota bacterium]
MRAITFHDELRVTQSQPKPEPSATEALVRVRLAGICNTDIEITKGYMGFRGVLGHEFVGTAESGPFAGKRVVGEINAACGHCVMCLSGNRTHCLNRTVLGIHDRNGAMADYLSLPHENLHPVPDSVSDQQAVFTEPLAAALEILEGVHIRPSERVVVVGDGKLGQLVAQVIALVGADLTVVGRHAQKLALVQRRGINTCLEGDAARLRGADVVVDCAGSAGGFALAAQLVRARGRVVLKSTIQGAHTVSLTPLAVNEVTLIGSRCGPFPAALRLLERGAVDVESLVSEVYPLHSGVAAFARAQAPGVMKVLLDAGYNADS